MIKLLSWKEVKGINNNMNHRGNIDNGVLLPKLNEEVLFCRKSFDNPIRDIYFSGFVYETGSSINVYNSVMGTVETVVDGLKWTRFNKPETNNNIGYAIAYLNENGNNFMPNVPNIVCIEKDEAGIKVKEFKKLGFSKITVFKYIKPCTFQYDWDYISKNKVSVRK